MPSIDAIANSSGQLPGTTAGVAATNTTPGKATGVLTGSMGMDKDAFLRLFIASLKNQDPTDPMDNKEMLAQFTQFAMIESIDNMSNRFNDLALSESAALIGKAIEAYGPDQQRIAGVVERIEQRAGKVVLIVDGVAINPVSVITVTNAAGGSGT
jgi:flagellar basal-body rod modification protein FlgD